MKKEPSVVPYAPNFSTQEVDSICDAAKQGDADSQSKLGWMYANGRNITQDYVQAVNWYRKAAEQGFAKAQFNLGLMYARGQGVAQDYIQVVSWYRKAAEQGFTEAQHNLSVMYASGQGVPKDLVLAYVLISLAAVSGIEETVALRAKLAKLLSLTQLAQAQKLATSWKVGQQLPASSSLLAQLIIDAVVPVNTILDF